MQTMQEKISLLREKLGRNLVIMGHHYQGDDVIRHVDFAGDSLQLAQMMDSIEAEHIVFCGVHFMAESACLLAKEGQKVYLPDESASCLMAEMTPAESLDIIIEKIKATGKNIIPLAYVNTSLAVKAVVGKHGGAVCTSANARTMLEWAMAQGDSVLFLPDRNLGNNMGNLLGIPQEARHTLDVRENGAYLDFDAIEKSQLIFWDGCCPIHEFFQEKHISDMRAKYADAKVYLHPECPQELVQMSDGAGSTSFLIKVADEAEDGATIVIGTESNLVDRLTKKHAGRVNVVPLLTAICPDMAKITEENLLKTLEDIDNGIAKDVQIDRSLTQDAVASLDRMLNQCK